MKRKKKTRHTFKKGSKNFYNIKATKYSEKLNHI